MPPPVPKADPTSIPVTRVGPELYLAAARRIVSQANPDRDAAARRLVQTAPRHGIDFSLCFATLHEGLVAQAVLVVKGAGRTAMMFVSEPPPDRAEPVAARAERAACLRAACDHLRKALPPQVHVAQVLPEPAEVWTLEAAADAGFVHVGNLTYLRREARRAGAPKLKGEREEWPAGVVVTRLADLGGPGESGDRERERTLLASLDASYEDTLDCPELCGMRETRDVLDSHRSTGVFDPSTWWVVSREGRPAGCMLLSRTPDQRAFELVYLGLAKEVRGLGLGTRLLKFGIEQCRKLQPTWGVTCAVDERNVPALRLYETLGFQGVTRRVAMVRRV